jgi:hypothetical protein
LFGAEPPAEQAPPASAAKWLKRGGAALVVALGATFGIQYPWAEERGSDEPRQEQDEGDPVSTPGAESSAPTSPADIPPNIEISSLIPPELSAEALDGLSQEEIADRFSIKAPAVSTPEEFVNQFIERINAMHNVGSEADFEANGTQVDASGDTYARVLWDEYVKAATEGLFGITLNIQDEQLADQARRKFLAAVMTDTPYLTEITLVDGSLSITLTSEGTWDIRLRVVQNDNFRAVDSVSHSEEWIGYDEAYNNRTFDLFFRGVHVDEYGHWSATSWRG